MKKQKPHVGRKQQRAEVLACPADSTIPESSDRLGPSFPIVGMGASAGGLEALEKFFGHLPKNSGLGFVVVQHLDPTQKGLLAELLQHRTPMPVRQITDGMKIEPDHVYVIPPNKDLSILHGVLHLLEPAAPRGLRLPIDFFFRSLAEDQHEHGVGVIFSGMGSDGTLGLRAIKERGGGAFVQSPETAKFDSMPRMAIETGLADVVAPAEELPVKIANYLKHIPFLARADHKIADKDQNALDKVMILLRTQTGNDFSLYKKSTIYRRIERRMGLHQVSKITDYIRYLGENPQESEFLFKELLIGVTSFFRDPEAWQQLKEELVPAFLAAHPRGTMLRAWTIGCSTGEEAYSLAIVLREAIEQDGERDRSSIQIFATDLDKDAIDKARAGTYPANISADVSEERLRRFFNKNERGGYDINKEIRSMVTFAPQNLVMHPPFTKLDIVTCRNLLIYLDAELQKKLLPLFHYILNPGGLLLLGNAETVGAATDLFTPVGRRSRLYRRLGTSSPAHLEFPSSFGRRRLDKMESSSNPEALPRVPNLQTLADQLLLQSYSPPAVLVTREGDILYVSGKTGRYLEPAAGKANWNLFAMAREGLSERLSEAFHKAVRGKITLTVEEVKVGVKKDAWSVAVVVQPLTGPESLKDLVLIVFMEAAGQPSAKLRSRSEHQILRGSRSVAMAQELQRVHEELQSVRSEMQISQEELRSTNEESLSMNEELQSMNEELTTSKEEVQSMNEELQTVNHELQAKIDELLHTSNDMKNLLNSTEIATLFLDDSLLVRRFTNKMASIISLIPSDVGRPVTDIVTALDYSGMVQDIREVMRTKAFVEKAISARDGRWFTVRIMPYVTHENKIDGVVVTFADITEAKKLEAALRKAQLKLEARFSHQTAELKNSRQNSKAGVKAARTKSERKRVKG